MAFSCKRRGVCPSCNASRAHDTAIHLVERVLPQVPFRQWTLSFPKRIRWYLARETGRATRGLNAAFLCDRFQIRHSSPKVKKNKP